MSGKTEETAADKAMVLGSLFSVLGFGVLRWLHPDALKLGMLGILMLTGGFIVKTVELTGGSLIKTPSAICSIFKAHKFLIAGLLIYLIPSIVMLALLIGDGWLVVLQNVWSFNGIMILINIVSIISFFFLFSPITILYFAVSYGLLLLFYWTRESDQRSRPRKQILNQIDASSTYTPKSFLRRCIECGKDIPIASEECQYCQTEQQDMVYF